MAYRLIDFGFQTDFPALITIEQNFLIGMAGTEAFPLALQAAGSNSWQYAFKRNHLSKDPWQDWLIINVRWTERLSNITALIILIIWAYGPLLVICIRWWSCNLSCGLAQGSHCKPIRELQNKDLICSQQIQINDN